MVTTPEAHPPDSPTVDLSTDGGLRARILIVDDSYMVAEMLSNFLGKQGCSISYALDGSAALDQVRLQTPDLIIADWVMPTLDGLELCRQLRQSPEFAWIYYIIMTAREGNDGMDRALEAGADEFLSKPFQAAELMTRVRAGLRIVESRRQQQVKAARAANSALQLTIGTRQTLVSILPKRMVAARNLAEPLSLFVLRLANLGQLSSSLNGEQKKELLEEFSLRLMDNLRQEDDLFRYDEGQYIIILAGTTLAAAEMAAERCSQRMAQLPFVIQGDTIGVQIQCGTATLSPEDDPQGLLRRAVQGMRDARNLPATAIAAGSDPQFNEHLRSLQTENQELRKKVAHFATENKQLRQQLQQLIVRIKQSQPTP